MAAKIEYKASVAKDLRKLDRAAAWRVLQKVEDTLAAEGHQGQALSIHTHPNVLAWMTAQQGRMQLVFLPLHASWLDQIELWFSILERQCLKRASLRTRAAMTARIYAFGRHWNRTARPLPMGLQGLFAPPVGGYRIYGTLHRSESAGGRSRAAAGTPWLTGTADTARPTAATAGRA